METGSYGEIGALLTRAREERGLSREEASRLLHIRLRYVNALEEGRFSDMPGVIYAKGYLQNYAGALGLDRDEILRRFEQVEGSLVKKGFYLPQAFRSEKTPNQLFVWGGLIIGVVIYMFWLILSESSKTPISVVDDFNKTPEKAHISAFKIKDVACFKPQDVLYPPCTKASEAGYGLLPLRRQMNTIMDLASLN